VHGQLQVSASRCTDIRSTRMIGGALRTMRCRECVLVAAVALLLSSIYVHSSLPPDVSQNQSWPQVGCTGTVPSVHRKQKPGRGSSNSDISVTVHLSLPAITHSQVSSISKLLGCVLDAIGSIHCTCLAEPYLLAWPALQGG
jgi:hypothetical protein